MEVELIIEPHLDENVRAEALAKMKLNERYTKISIEKNILEILKDNHEILGSQYYEEKKDISLFVLTWLYGYGQNAKYQIEPLDKVIVRDKYQFRDFIIRGVK